MKVFVAGATGVLGRALVPMLVGRAHGVVGMTRSASKEDLVRGLGARPVVADALDPDAVAQAVGSAEPEVIVHRLTALSGKMSATDMGHPERSSAATMTNRLRTEATDHLLAAGGAVGPAAVCGAELRGFSVGSHGRAGADRGRSLESQRLAGAAADGAGGVPLFGAGGDDDRVGRGSGVGYGGFYGPGTSISLAPDAVMAAPIRKRRFPIVGDRGGVFSHVQVDDAATPAVAVERGQPGIYNVVDNEPAPVREWLPVLASALDAKPPRRVPRWLGRLAAGGAATAMMTEARGASNEKAKRELGWQPRYASWRQGFAQGLG
jgi:nucleoside-diphosphate-sugar epimerase